MSQKHWIQEIYRWQNKKEEWGHKFLYRPKKLARRWNTPLQLPHEFLAFLWPHWDFINQNQEILDALEHPELYDFIDIIDILAKLPKSDIEAKVFLQACMRFWYSNQKVLRVFDIPHIIPPQAFRRFLPEMKLDDWERGNLSQEDEAKIRRLYPDIRWDFWSNYTEAAYYTWWSERYTRVFQQENPQEFAQVQSNGVSVLSQSIFSRYKKDYREETVARGKSPVYFLNQGFSRPHTHIDDIKREQELLSHIIEHPEIERLVSVFKEAYTHFRNYSMLLYPVEGSISHEWESHGRSIRDLYHLARYRKVREKNQMQELNAEFVSYGISPEELEKTDIFLDVEEISQDDLSHVDRELIRLYKLWEFTNPEDKKLIQDIIARHKKQKEDDAKKSDYRHDIYHSTMDIYDPEDPYGTQEYFFQRYPDWVKSSVYSSNSYVDVDLLQALQDGLTDFEAACRWLRDFFSHFPKDTFPHFAEVETQLRAVETYFWKKYLFRETNASGEYSSYNAESHVSSSPERWNLKELDMFLQNLGIIGGLIELVDIIQSEWWSKTKLWGSSWNSYKNAWNLSHEKARQVTESLTHDGTIKVFSSANTSGKSYLLKRDALVHMAMQWFGYAPAESSELAIPIQAFFFFDRPDNQNIEAFFKEVEKKYGLHDVRIMKFFQGIWNPSAFMMEALSLTMQLRTYIPGSLIYLDEVFTTTSALDQAALLCALLEHFHSDGNQIILATHNELLLKYFETGFAGFPVELLHLGYTQTPAWPRNTYKIELWRGDSLFLDVAQREQAPQVLIEQARNYLSGNISFVENAENPSPIALQYYTPEMRESLSGEARSILQLFSKANPSSILKLYSKNPDIASALQFPRIQRWDNEHHDDYYESLRSDPRYYDLLVHLLFHSEFQSSQETLERQQMFSQLVEKCDFEKISELLNALSYFDDAMKQLENQKINAQVWNCLFVEDAQAWKKKLEEEKKQSAAVFENLKDTNNPWYDSPYTSPLMSAELKKLLMILELNTKILWETPYFSELKKVLERLIYLASDENRTQDNNLKEIIELENKFTPLLLAYLEKLPAIAYSEFLKSEHKADIEAIVRLDEHRFQSEKNQDQEKSDIKKWEKRRNRPKVSDTWDALYYIGNFPEEVGKLAQEFIWVDSVYIKQSLNFLQEQARALQNGTFVYRESSYWNEKWETSWQNSSSLSRLKPKKPWKDFGLSNNYLVPNTYHNGFSSLMWIFARRNPWELYTEVLWLSTLLYWAHTIKTQKLSKVYFSETLEVRLDRLRHLNFLNSKTSVANDFSVGTWEQVRILTGPNGSGKTFHEQSVILGILSGLSTWYTPASNPQMPFFDSLIYLERVVEENSEWLSAWANELKYWKEIWQEMESSKNPFVCFDELFSTTSPRYQEACSFAVLHFLREQHILWVLSTHNHELVSEISGDESFFPAYHFGHTLTETWEIEYSRHIAPWHAPSLWIEVAEKMWFDTKIIARAKEIREQLSIWNTFLRFK